MVDTKSKLLWIGDVVATTGFARVSENVLKRLKETGNYEIHVLGCNWHGDTTPLQQEYYLYPASNRFQQAPFGEDRIREIVERIKPDVICTINDIWIINEQWKRIQDLKEQLKFKFVGYYPMDSYEWYAGLLDTINNWDAAVCYTEFGAQETINAGFQKPVTVIPHGLTQNQFFPIDKKEARKKLGLNEDDFIVFNGNRNQFRKRIDITISAFAKFAVGRPDTKLYLHMGMKDMGWDVMPLFKREMARQGLDANNRIIMTTPQGGAPAVPFELLNVIYNTADVGVNTCKGEGWGLVNFEHAACKVAQIVPDHTSCKEIFDGTGELIRSLHWDVDTNLGRIMPCPDDNHLAEILGTYYENRELLAQVGQACFDRVTDIQFDWETVASQFDEVFQEVLKVEEKAKPKIIKPKKKMEKVALGV
jgi:D-inositol-3-phosphate glycosyltransferase